MGRFVFTCGDINGIGPEILIKTINKLSSKKNTDKYTLIIPEKIFNLTSRIVEPTFEYKIIRGITSVNHTDDIISVLDFKSAGIKYPGQTEMYADWCKVKNFVMTFLSGELRVGLYSIHIPVKDVSSSINKKLLTSKLDTVIKMLKFDLGIKKPRIALLGLNPHAGENGIIGDEEKKVIEPVINHKHFKGIIEGTFSSDAFFAGRRFKDYDLVFGLYHDQVLIPFKYINSGRGVNYSAGLPIIRTSPDHGTAYDIAGHGIADESSMIEAYNYAKFILRNRKKINNG
ncbi:MAG: 4-hydroxythreonine-4-phosphate dehydrogenase PdxA [Chlorobiota bacterium]|nr:MAG: 4-hydroxythreonine-4-phosphate dehydrogenase PdxA [Chlorobiota bacterium]